MKVINVKVNDNLEIINLRENENIIDASMPMRIPSGNYKSVLINFDLSEAWLSENFDYFATFEINSEKNVETEVKQIGDYQYACYMPYDVLHNSCRANIGIYASTLTEDGNIEKRLSSKVFKIFIVDGAFSDELRPPEEVSPGMAEKLQKEINDITKKLEDKVDIIEGKNLSTNDFDDEYKNKLDSIDKNAQVNKIERIKVDDKEISPYEKTINIDLSGKVDKDKVYDKEESDKKYIQDSKYVHTDNNYTDEDKEKLDNIDLQPLTNGIKSNSDKITKMENDIFEKGKVKDTFIHLDDSISNEFKGLSVDGVCKQVITTGKNKFNNTLFEEFTSNLKYIDVILEGNKEYTVSSNLPKSSQGTANIFAYNSSSSGASTGINDIGVAATSRTITTNDDGKIIIAYRDNNSELTDEKNKYLYQIEEGPDATEYEPYTGGQPSPRPEFPQPIKVIENSIDVTSCNKNLFDIGTFAEKVIKEIKVSQVDNSSIRIDGTTTSQINIWFNDIYLKLKAGTYCFSTDENSKILYVLKSEGNNLFVTKANTKFTLNEETIVDQLFMQIDNGKTFDNQVVKIQLEQNSQATDFVQHLKSLIEVNLPEREFIGKINDTFRDKLKAEYNEEDGKYHLILNKMVGKVVLDGSEDEIYSFNSGTTQFYMTKANFEKLGLSPKNNSNSISNYFRSASTWVLNCISFSSSGALNIWIDDSTIKSTSLFKAWLSTHNTEVYYQLATPYVVDLGVVDMPITYDGVTNVFTDSDLMPEIEVEYYKDFHKMIANMQQEIDELKTLLSSSATSAMLLDNYQSDLESEV